MALESPGIILEKESQTHSISIKSPSAVPGGSVVKNLLSNAGDTRDASSIPGSGRCPGERNANPFQYSCLENSMDREDW